MSTDLVATDVATSPQRKERTEIPRLPDSQRQFGIALEKVIEHTGLSQKKFAEKAGVDHSTVSRQVGGHRNPTRAMIDRYAERHNLDEEDHNALLTAAGFLAKSIIALLPAPVGQFLTDFLDETLPLKYRENNLRLIELINEATTHVRTR